MLYSICLIYISNILSAFWKRQSFGLFFYEGPTANKYFILGTAEKKELFNILLLKSKKIPRTFFSFSSVQKISTLDNFTVFQATLTIQQRGSTSPVLSGPRAIATKTFINFQMASLHALKWLDFDCWGWGGSWKCGGLFVYAHNTVHTHTHTIKPMKRTKQLRRHSPFPLCLLGGRKGTVLM